MGDIHLDENFRMAVAKFVIGWPETVPGGPPQRVVFCIFWIGAVVSRFFGVASQEARLLKFRSHLLQP